MAIIISRRTGGGIRKLSELEIDTTKDFGGYSILNAPMVGYVYDPTGGTYYLAGDSQSPEINSIVTQFTKYPAGIINTVFFPESKAIYSLVGWRPLMVEYPSNSYYYSDGSIGGVYIYNTGTGSYDEVLRIFTGLYEGSFSVGKGIEWKRYSTFIIKKSDADPNPALDIRIPITDNVAGTGYFHINSDEVTINTLTGDITLNPASGNIITHGIAFRDVSPYTTTIGDTIDGNAEIVLSPDIINKRAYIEIIDGENNPHIASPKNKVSIWAIQEGMIELGTDTCYLELTEHPAGISISAPSVGISTDTGDIILSPAGETTTGKDIEITDNSKGVILKDRTTGTRYRLYVDNGTLGIEAVT